MSNLTFKRKKQDQTTPSSPLSSISKPPKDFIGFCSVCRKKCQVIHKDELIVKTWPIKIRSAKNKGMSNQKKIVEAISKVLNLPEDDVLSTGSGQTGIDIRLSNNAKKVFPFHAIECADQQSLSIWAKFSQAEAHASKQLSGKEPGNGKPILIFKRNHSDTYAMIKFSDLLDLIKVSDNEKLKEIFGL